MKKYTEQELQTMADEIYFKKNKDLKDILAVEDGHFFYSNRQNYAISHAGDKNIFLLKRSEAKPKAEPKPEPTPEPKPEVVEKPKDEPKVEKVEETKVEDKPKDEPKNDNKNTKK